MEQLISKASTYSDEAVLEMLTAIGGGDVTVEERMVRAALIEVYSQRHGAEMADALMDLLGM